MPVCTACSPGICSRVRPSVCSSLWGEVCCGSKSGCRAASAPPAGGCISSACGGLSHLMTSSRMDTLVPLGLHRGSGFSHACKWITAPARTEGRIRAAASKRKRMKRGKKPQKQTGPTRAITCVTSHAPYTHTLDSRIPLWVERKSQQVLDLRISSNTRRSGSSAFPPVTRV